MPLWEEDLYPYRIASDAPEDVEFNKQLDDRNVAILRARYELLKSYEDWPVAIDYCGEQSRSPPPWLRRTID